MKGGILRGEGFLLLIFELSEILVWVDVRVKGVSLFFIVELEVLIGLTVE